MDQLGSCDSSGAHLLKIDDMEEQKFIFDKIRNHSSKVQALPFFRMLGNRLNFCRRSTDMLETYRVKIMHIFLEYF